jgi:hypothetical protein
MWTSVLTLSMKNSLVVVGFTSVYPLYFFLFHSEQSDRKTLLLFPLSFSVELSLRTDDINVMRGVLVQALFSTTCGSLIRRHNEELLAKTKALRDDAVAANQSKLDFIAKMR